MKGVLKGVCAGVCEKGALCGWRCWHGSTVAWKNPLLPRVSKPAQLSDSRGGFNIRCLEYCFSWGGEGGCWAGEGGGKVIGRKVNQGQLRQRYLLLLVS